MFGGPHTEIAALRSLIRYLSTDGPARYVSYKPGKYTRSQCILIIYGSANVNTIPPQTLKPFENYARYAILPDIQFCGTTSKSVDIVFNECKKSSLRGEARVIRGHGVRRRKTYITISYDMTLTQFGLFQLHTEIICQVQITCTILGIIGEYVIYNDNHKSLEAVVPSLHEAADLYNNSC